MFTSILVCAHSGGFGIWVRAVRSRWLILPVILAAAPAAWAVSWSIENVDEARIWVNDSVTLALGKDGTPHIGHSLNKDQYCHYAYKSGEDWIIEVVDRFPSGWGASIALDATGTPAMAYRLDMENLAFARRTPAGWVHEVVGAEYDAPCPLIYSSDGVPHIFYSELGSPWSLMHAWKPSGVWKTEVVDPAPVSGFDTSVALDREQRAHICHWVSVAEGVAHQNYTYWDGTNWNTEVIDSGVGGCNVFNSGIAVARNGDVHMAWQVHRCASSGALRYALRTATGVTVTTIDSGFSRYSAGCSLVLDRTGLPHIVYGTLGEIVGGDSQLRYAHLDDAGNWVIEVVDNDGDCGELSSLVIDPLGYLHTAYYAGDGTTQDGWVRYARTLEPVAHPLGDLNCDGAINAFDIDPFVLALTGREAYEAAFPACDYLLADINEDGAVNAFDIDPFVQLVTGD